MEEKSLERANLLIIDISSGMRRGEVYNSKEKELC